MNGKAGATQAPETSTGIHYPLHSVFTDFVSDAYDQWRTDKLQALKASVKAKDVLQLEDPMDLSLQEIANIRQRINTFGFALYRIDPSQGDLNPHSLLELCRQLGLQQINTHRCAHTDGVTRIEQDQRGERKHYIPYTNKPLNWHTDGYYNQSQERIRAFVLHCVQNADSGGESLLFDPELMYIVLRDRNPKWVQALFREDVLAIPENAVNSNNIRVEQVGPVFWLDEQSSALQMRYTARTRSIRWRHDHHVQEAVAFIRETLAHSPYIQKYKLNPGEGVISNNCLHGRLAFNDAEHDAGRLLYRARFFDRVNVNVDDIPAQARSQC